MGLQVEAGFWVDVSRYHCSRETVEGIAAILFAALPLNPGEAGH